MKTADLIELLVGDPIGPTRHLVWRRLAIALLLGFVGGVALVIAYFGTKDLLVGIAHLTTARKALFVLAVAAASGWAAAQLGRPGLQLGRAAWLGLAAPFVIMAIWGVIGLAMAPPEWRVRLWLGWTWAVCPGRILAFSLPALAASLWAMRGLAPTRLRAAGAAAGLFAGAVGSLAYVVYCREPGAAYLSIWYPLGMALPAAIGAALGPRILRW